MNKVPNWREILLYAYSVRYALAASVASLGVAWKTGDLVAIIPAVLAVLVIFARIIPQPNMKQTEEILDRLK
jgi:hypothetical protein